MRKKKIIPFLLSGVLLFSIHSTAKATTGGTVEAEINKLISDDGYQSFIKYESTTRKSSATKLLGSVFAQISKNNDQIGAEERYRPSSIIDNLKVKNQKAEAETNECWVNSFTSAFEAYNLKHGIDVDEVYSARHINLWANTNFSDGIRTAGRFNRNAVGSSGGNYDMATAYATQGYGPVLEEDMPSNTKVQAVPFSSLQTENGQRKELNGYVQFPPVYKAIVNDSNVVKYYNSFDYDTPYTTGGNLLDWCDDEITDIDSYRNKIKSQIQQNGSVGAYIMQYDGDKDIFVKAKYDTSTRFFKKYNHAVLIVGWDDNYEPPNNGVDFTGDTAWVHKGAYIALNSYGDDKYYDGYVYISYDDFYVEQKLYGMTDISKGTYDNVYYYDELGCPAEFKFGGNEITVENIFERTTSKNENLTQVAITSSKNQTADVYYTQSFDEEGLPIDYKILKQNVSLQIGGTPVSISDINLTENKFAIAVTYKNSSDSASIPAEITGGVDIYANAIVNTEESYILRTSNDNKFTKDGNYEHIQQISANGRDYLFNPGIKAYTKEINDPTPTDLIIISTQYRVNNQNKMITRLPVGTTVEDFKSKITVNQDYIITDKNGNEITTTMMRTGYKLKIGNIYYDISVVADISGSGGDSYTRSLDLAKMRSHLIEENVLRGVHLEAADTNGNGTVDASDLSRIRKISIE